MYTVPPLAATTKSLNIAQSCTLSVDAETCGTILELNFVVPFNLLYPPSILGSKFYNCNASPGCIAKTSLFKTKPPAQLTTIGFCKPV